MPSTEITSIDPAQLSSVDDNKPLTEVTTTESSVFDVEELTGEIPPAPAKPQPKPEINEEAEEESIETETPEDVEPEKVEDKESEPEPELEKEPEKIHGNNKRDFTGFSPEEIKILKKMDNQRFNYFAPKWREMKNQVEESKKVVEENTRLKEQIRNGGVPDNWYEHPAAFTLTPEYQNISSRYEKISFEDTFYQQQLAAVKAGEDWHYITGYDQAGNPIYSAPQKASNQADIWLTTNLTKAVQLKSDLENRVRTLQSSFTNQHKGLSTTVNNVISEHIKSVREDLRPKEDVMKHFDEKVFPKQLQNNPLYSGFRLLYGLCISQAEALAKKSGDDKLNTKLKNDKALGGPNPAKVKREPSKAPDNSNILSLDDFIPKED